MADYKELLGSLMNRAKAVAEQTGVAGVYQKGVDRTKSYSRMAKLTLDMNSQSEELRKVYTEIGKLYFDQAQDDPQGFFAPLFAQAKALRQDLLDKQTELEGLKESLRESDEEEGIEVEITQEEPNFDAVVDATESEGKGEHV